MAEIKFFSRRTFLIGGTAALTLNEFLQKTIKAYAFVISDNSLLPNADNVSFSPLFNEELNEILHGAIPLNSKIFSLELPQFAENGSIVPFKMTANYPMDKKNYVQSFHLLSTLNPSVLVASFILTPESGKAEISGRMRLAKSQNVYALAHLSIGQFFISTQKIEVLVGGCGME